MKKILAFMLVLVLAFSLVACGETAPAETPEETPAETPEDAAPETTSILELLDIYQVPEIANTGWSFVGGYIDGAPMTADEAKAALENYGGTLQLVFAENGAVLMIQGTGSVEGTYEAADENSVTVSFPSISKEYVVVFTVLDETPVLVLVDNADTTMGIYFAQAEVG